MQTRNVVAALLAIGLLATAGTAFAQNETNKDKTILERIDGVGRSIFSGIFPAKKDKPKSQVNFDAESDSKYLRKPFDMRGNGDDAQPSTQRAGSILSGGSRSRSKPAARQSQQEYMPEDTMPESVRREADDNRPSRRAVADRSMIEEEETPAAPERRRSPAPVRRSYDTVDDHPVMELPDEPASSTSKAPLKESEPDVVVERREPSRTRETADEMPEPTNSLRPARRPLHERLSGFRESVFSDSPVEKKESEPKADQLDEPAPTAIDEPKTLEPRPVMPRTAMPHPATRPLIAQRMAPATKSDAPAEPVAEPVAEPAENAPSIAKVGPATSRPKSPDVLFVRKSPVLNVETIGPRTISVGREAVYEVSMINSGEVAAEELMVFVSLPEWAQISSADASLGTVAPAAADRAGNTLLWKLGSVGAKGRERLLVRLIPKQSRPFDLAVRWESKPTSSRTMIEVQEPRLQLQLEGPKDVLYGKKQTYRLRLNNTGNGAAENVVLTLTPIGAGENLPASHKIGVLPAGGEKILDVELVARQAGALTIQADARASGVVMAELTEKVNVRRGALKLECDAPKVQFVGTVTTATVQVRNTGTAAAKNVNLVLSLPPGTKYLSGIDGARVATNGSKVDWTVENIEPQADLNFTFKCSLTTAGMNRLHIGATADDDLFTSAEAVVRVDAVANISLDVKDPATPIALGDEGIYEVRVRNRGTREAQGVEVIGYFSQGVEPVNATGAPNRFGEGQVIFQPIASLAPGAEAVFKIHAKADMAGNHVFRAEVRCRALNTRLIREATNLYYAENGAAEQAAPVARSPMAPAGTPAPAGPMYDAMRTPPSSSQGVQMLAPPPRR